MAYPKHDAALARAQSDLKRGTKEEPLGSNSGPRVRIMQGHTWLGGTGWPWCVAACVTWAEEAGFVLPYQGAGAYAFLDWARKTPGWTRPLKDAVPGDFVVWNIGAGHMSMLVKYDPQAGTVETIDGNSSDRVRRCLRPASQVRGVVHLPERLTGKPPQPKPPLFEVVTSENGSKVIYVSTASRVGKKLPSILAKYAKVTVRRRKRKPKLTGGSRDRVL